MTEEDIIKLIRAGGKAMDAGVKALYQGTAQHMLRFFVHQGVSGDEAEDVLQETFVKIVRGAASFGGQGTAKAWIWQVARNCLIDYKRKQIRLPATDHERRVAERGEAAAAEAKSGAKTFVRDGIRMTDFPYAGNDESFGRRSLVTGLDEEQWSRIAETTAAPETVSAVGGCSVDECVASGLIEFGTREPERAEALMLQMEGKRIEEIGQLIGRTVAATKEYLSQCRKKIQPFIAHCTDFLTT